MGYFNIYENNKCLGRVGAVTDKAIDWYYGLGYYNYTGTDNRIFHAAKIASGDMNACSNKFGNGNFIFSLYRMLTNKIG